ncbi:hypothetical protein HYT84_01145, partial [Candidatus Micrarchaeota archaeon]|nr:hypothetical protein [Candidatus Micrarchaeota archaeon]
PLVMYAASDSAVLKTTDGGENWEGITGELKDIHRIKISRSDPDILYAATFNGVFRSNDAGNSWIDATGDLKAKNVQAIEIHPANPEIVFIGHSSLWSSARSEERYIQGLLAHQGIYKTTDGGKTWVKSDSGIFEYNLEEVSTNPLKPYEAWFAAVASKGGYKTEDAGHNWRSIQLPTLHYPMRIKYSFQNPNKIYATGWQNGGPFAISENGGAYWKLISEQAFFNGLNRGKNLYKDTQGQSQIHLHGLAVDPKNDNIVYAGSIYDADNPVGFPLDGAHIFKSSDWGLSWTESDEGFPHEKHTAIHDIVVDPVDSSVVYLATTKHESEIGIGIYKSTDAGKSWKEINNGLEDLDINAIIVNPNDNTQLIAAAHHGLYRSDDAGESWINIKMGETFDVEYVTDDPNTVYASANDGVLMSKDFGESWENVSGNLPAGEGQGIGVDPTGEVVYAAVKDAGVFVARLVEVEPVEPVSEYQTGYGISTVVDKALDQLPDLLGGIFGQGKMGGPEEQTENQGGQQYSSGPPDCETYQFPPDCGMIPDVMGKTMCEQCKESSGSAEYKQNYYQKGAGNYDKLFEEQCLKMDLPPDCNVVLNKEERGYCEKCKIFKKEKGIKEETPSLIEYLIDGKEKYLDKGKEGQKKKDPLTNFIDAFVELIKSLFGN